jgi:mono/diheme cytochrome c family protein
MRHLLTGAMLAVAVLAVLGAVAGLVFLKTTGLTARGTPGRVEITVARQLRALATPAEYRDMANPVLQNDESIRNGLEHFADHCASCHANDGSGNVEMGKGMFPPVPDMRASPTQEMSDGELFYVIENGVRFTGMPAWGTGTIQGEEASWHLVSFLRHLPNLTPEELEEMAAMNPRPPAEIRQEMEAEQFLQGGDVAPAAPRHEGRGHD